MKHITANDRALIEAAIAAGKVKVVPTGLTAMDQSRGRCLREILDQVHANRRRAEAFRTVPSQREERVGIKARTGEQRVTLNAACLEMMAQGLTYREMARRLGMSVGPVYARCQKIKKHHATN